jgi:hypothetical protein
MTCTQPGAVTPEDLVAYADGDAPERVRAHVLACRRCRDEARRYAAVGRRLADALRRFECPTSHVLGELELGLLPADQTLALARHVADCPRCADEMRTLREFLVTEPAVRPGVVERLRWVVAALVQPAGAAPLGALRGVDDESSRTYRAEDATITVSIEPGSRPGRAALLGLLVRESAPERLDGLMAELVGSDGTTDQARTDSLGSFSFADVAPGLYRLQLRLEDQVLVAEGLSIEA